VPDQNSQQFPGLETEFLYWKIQQKKWRSMDIDPQAFLKSLVTDELNRLDSPGPRQDFIELCNAGCVPIVLAGVTGLLRYSPRLAKFWENMAGQTDECDKAIRSLEKTSRLIRKTLGQFDLDNEIAGQRLSAIGRLPPQKVVSELELYIRLFGFTKSIRKETGTHSLEEVIKYVLSDFVKRLTRRFHDRNTSGVIAGITGKSEYNEIAHRMWRLRNFNRLRVHYEWITRLLCRASIVIVYSE